MLTVFLYAHILYKKGEKKENPSHLTFLLKFYTILLL